MKRIATLLVIFATLSCSKESINQPCGLMEFKIAVSTEAKSTYFSGDKAIKWTRGDRIAVFDGEAIREFITEESSENAIFHGEISTDARDLKIIYPFVPDVNPENPEGIIPRTQWAVNNGFSDDANVSTGCCSVDNPELVLTNVPGYAKITIPSGFTNLKALDFVSEGETTCLLSPGEYIPSGNYYFCLPPKTMSAFTIILHSVDGKKASFGSEKENTIKRNAVLDLGTVPGGLVWESETTPQFYSYSLTFENGAWPFDTSCGTEKYPEGDKTYIIEGTGSYAFQASGKSCFSKDFLIGPNSVLGLPVIPGHKLVSVSITSSSECQIPFFTGEGGRRVSVVNQSSNESSCFLRIDGRPEESISLRNYSISRIGKMVMNYEQTSSERRIVTSVSANCTFTFEGGSQSDYITGVTEGRPYARPKESPEACNFYGPENTEDKLLLSLDFRKSCPLADFPSARQNSAVPETEYRILGTDYSISLGCSGTSDRYLYHNKNHLHCNYLRAKFPVIDNYRLEKVVFVQTIRNCAGEYLFGEGDAYKGLAASNYSSGKTENQFCFLPDGIPSGTGINCMSDHILQIDAINLEYRKIK